MLPRDLRRKLGQIARGETPAPAPVNHVSDKQPAQSSHSITCHAVIPADYDIETLGRTAAAAQGDFHLLDYSASRLVPGTELIPGGLAQFASRFNLRADDFLFLDIETTSFTSTLPLFLVGLMTCREGEMRVVQLFAKDYTEEPAVLSYLADLAGSYQRIVTFNGTAFDLPYLRDRAAYHRIRLSLYQDHLDLLKIARSTWKGKFRDCRLQTLEEHLCRRRRLEDTPGHLIPDLYHTFVRTRCWTPLRGAFFHNALDLLTMAELMALC